MTRFGHAASIVALSVALATPVGAQEQTTYVYDTLGRLTKVTRPGSTTEYTYDNANNRKQLTVGTPNRLPVAKNDGFAPDPLINVLPNGSVPFNPLSNDSDPDADAFYLTNVSGWDTSKGWVTWTPNCTATANTCVTYNAVAGQGSGSDTFSYAIADGRGGTANGTIKVTINAATPKPIISDSTSNIAANYSGSTNSYPLTLNIGGGTPTSLTVTSAPPSSAGTVTSTTNNSILFRPASAYSGQTLLQYTATNDGGTSAPATATINVRPAVAAVSGWATTGSQASLALYPLTNFTSLNLVGSGQGVYGNASISGTNVLYQPNSGAGQTETFAYTATTAGGTSTSASITFNITQGNRAPNAVDQIVDQDQSTTATLLPLANDSDPDPNDPLTLQSIGPLEFVYGNNGTPSNLGSITKSGNSVIFNAPPVCNCAYRSKYHVVRFSYTVADSHGVTSVAKHAINVYSNQAPIANWANWTIEQNTYTTITPLTDDVEPDGQGLMIKSIDNLYFAYGVVNGVQLTSAPADIGSVTTNGSTITYRSPFVTSSGAYHSSYVVVVVTYTVSDGHGGTSQSYEVLNVYAPS